MVLISRDCLSILFIISKLIWNNPLKKSLTSAEILSQAMIFLMAGYETTSSTLSFLGYNLAMNLDKQEKLISEIDQVLEKYVISYFYEHNI